jgi:hypothetical protein
MPSMRLAAATPTDLNCSLRFVLVPHLIFGGDLEYLALDALRQRILSDPELRHRATSEKRRAASLVACEAGFTGA